MVSIICCQLRCHMLHIFKWKSCLAQSRRQADGGERCGYPAFPVNRPGSGLPGGTEGTPCPASVRPVAVKQHIAAAARHIGGRQQEVQDRFLSGHSLTNSSPLTRPFSLFSSGHLCKLIIPQFMNCFRQVFLCFVPQIGNEATLLLRRFPVYRISKSCIAIWMPP